MKLKRFFILLFPLLLVFNLTSNFTVHATSDLTFKVTTPMIRPVDSSYSIENFDAGEVEQLNNISKDIYKYVRKIGNTYVLDTSLMEKDGYSPRVISFVSSQYKYKYKYDLVLAQSIKGKSVKLVAEWLKKNWKTKIEPKIPKVAKPYFSFNFAVKVIDQYIEISDSVDVFLTNVTNALLPSWLEFLTPLIVAIMTMGSPF